MVHDDLPLPPLFGCFKTNSYQIVSLSYSFNVFAAAPVSIYMSYKILIRKFVDCIVQ